MKRRIVCALLILAMSIAVTACGEGQNEISQTADGSGGNTATAQSTELSSVLLTATAAEYFSDGDYRDVTGEEPNCSITLSGNTGIVSDTTRGSSGETVTITSKGIYRITGSSENVTIVVDDETESGNVYLILDQVTMENDSKPCIIVESADKVILQCVGTSTLICSSSEEKYDAAIYAKDDLTINGEGSLSVTSGSHGIFCKKDCKLASLKLEIEADGIGIQSEKTVRMDGAEVLISSGHDGIQVESDSADNYFCLFSGSVTIHAGYDGIDVENSESGGTGKVMLMGGNLSVTAGGGSDRSKQSSVSQKGIKCDGEIVLGGTQTDISAADDGLHSSGDILISEGSLTLTSSDDGIHADGMISVSGGKVSVEKSYEGMEAYAVSISGGDVSVYASDDGINAAGGSDSTSEETMPNAWGGDASSTGSLTISGGTLYVNAQGDGLDSNGSLYVSGGTVIVEGPTDNGNGALDKGDGSSCTAQITGGTVLAIGSTGMAVNFDSGTQCSGLVNLSGDAGTTITVEDGSGFSFTTTKAFHCIVYSSGNMSQGNSYTVTAGDETASMDFSSGLYYSDVSSMGGGPGGMGREPQEQGGNW